MPPALWTVRLSADADRDLDDIILWTAEHLGSTQAHTYRQLLFDVLAELLAGPDHVLSRARDEIDADLRTLHIGRRGRPGRHLILYRAGAHAVDVLRILHDSMDLPSHVPPGREEA